MVVFTTLQRPKLRLCFPSEGLRVDVHVALMALGVFGPKVCGSMPTYIDVDF